MTLRFTIHRKITWLLLFSIFSLAFVSRLIYIGERNIERTNFGINQTYEIIVLLQQMVTSVAEPGPGLPLHRQLDSLQLLARDNGDQRQHIAMLRIYAAKDSLQAAKALLYTMIREEGNLLTQRKDMNETADRRVASGLVIARFAGFLFFVIILVQLNKELTRRKKVQEQLVRAIREAEEAKQMQEQFLANMSHEIRTP
jgi:signal transduction histidine kinase